MNPDIYDLHLLVLGSPGIAHTQQDSSPPVTSDTDAASSSSTTKDVSDIDLAAGQYDRSISAPAVCAQQASDAHGHSHAHQASGQASSAAGGDNQATQGILTGMALTFARHVSEGPEDDRWDDG
ncbi:MAG: hypothetical protein Q9208_003354 [Pyrenodesmia sp. 3 TL-2023]